MGEFDFTYGKKNSAFNQDQLKGGLKRSDLKDNELLNIFDKVDTNPKDGVLDKKELSVFQQALKRFAESDKNKAELSDKETKNYLKDNLINATKEKFQEFLEILTKNEEKADGSKVKDTKNMSENGKEFVRIEYEDGHTEDIFPDGSKVITVTKNGKTIVTNKDKDDKEIERTETETKDGKTITKQFKADKLIEEKTVSDNGTKTETITYEGDKATKVVEDLTTGDKITSIIEGDKETLVSKENTKTNIKTTYEDGKEITVNGDTTTIVEGEGDNQKTTVIKKVDNGTVETITDKSGVTEIITTPESKITLKKDTKGNILSKTEEKNGQTSLTTYEGKNSTTTVSKNGKNLEQTKNINGKTYSVTYDGEGNTTGVVVQYRENAKKLAKKFGCSEKELLELNGKKEGEDFAPGDVIKVPNEIEADNKNLRNRKSSVEAIKEAETARIRQEKWKAQDKAYRAVGLRDYKRSGEKFKYGNETYTVIGTMKDRARLLVRDSKGNITVASHDNKILKDSYVQLTNTYDNSKKITASNGKQYAVVGNRDDGHGRQIALDASGNKVILGRNPDGSFVPLKNSYVETSDSYDILQKQIAAQPKEKDNLIKQNASLSNKDIVRFKAKDGTVWYFDTKTGKPVNLSKQEAAMITKELDKAADGFLGFGTDEDKMIKANSKIFDPAVLAEINKYYESKGYSTGEYKSAYEAFLSSEISDSEIYTLNAELVNNGAILNQDRRDEIISTNVITYGNKSENRNAGLRAISNRTDYDNLQRNAAQYNKNNNIKGHFEGQDALQALLYNKTKGNADAMASANRNLIDPQETFLSQNEIKRIQAETGVYYIEQGNNDKAFTTQDSDMYQIMDTLLPDGKKVKDIASDADLMIAGYGEFSNEQIADEVIKYLQDAQDTFEATDKRHDIGYNMPAPGTGGGIGQLGYTNMYSQGGKEQAIKAFQLLKNEEVLKLVKEKMGDAKYQEIVDNIKHQIGINFSNVMLESNQISGLSEDEISKNKQQLEIVRKMLQSTENSYRNSVDNEGFKQDFVNLFRQTYSFGITRDNMDNCYAIAKSNLAKLDLAAEGKLVGSDGKPIPFEKAVEQIMGMNLDELNNEYLTHQAYGEMGLDIGVALATMPAGGAGGVKLLGTLGKTAQTLNTLSKSRTAINIASAIGGGLLSGGTQYAIDKTNLSSSVSGDTMANRATVENKALETGIMGTLGMGIGGQTEIIASKFASRTGKVVTNLLGFGVDLGSAQYMTGVFHDGHWDEGFGLNATLTSIGYLAGIRGAVKTRGITNKQDLDMLLNMHKKGKNQPNPLSESQIESLKKLNLEEAKNYLNDRGFDVEIKDNKLSYVDNQNMHILEFDNETGIVSKVESSSVKLSDKEFDEIIKQMKKSDEAEFNRIKSELEQGELTPEQIEILNKTEPKNTVKPTPEPEHEPINNKEIKLEDIQNQELKSKLENLNEHGIIEISDGENTYLLTKRDGKIQMLPDDSGVIIVSGGEEIKPIKLSKEELEHILPKKVEKKVDTKLKSKLGEKLYNVYIQIEQMIEKAKTLADSKSIKAMIESQFAKHKPQMDTLLEKLNAQIKKLKQTETVTPNKPIVNPRKAENLRNGQTNVLNSDDKLIVGNTVLEMDNLPPNIKNKIDSLVDGQELKLGRNDINPSDDIISREHLIIKKENGKLIIQDTSSNGTRIFDKENFEAYSSIRNSSVKRTDEYFSAEKAFIETTGGDYVLLNKLLASNDYSASYKLQNILKSTNQNNKQILETFLSTGISKGNALNKTNISMDDLGLLMMFNKNNTDVQGLISNPSNVQKYLDKTNKLLNELELQKFNYIDKQTGRYIESDVNTDLVSTIRNGGFEYQGEFVKAELNNNILNDMEAMIHGKSYIPEFKSGTKLNKVFNETKQGDAVAVGNRMYVNDGKNLIALNYDRETFEKLFPPMERFNITQGAIGDCYLVSTIDALMDSPKSRAEIYQMFSIDNNGKINISIASGNGRTYQFERFDSKGGHSKHENGLAMLEQAYAKFEIRNARNGAASGQTMINFNIDGGWMSDVTKGLLGGNSAKVMYNTEEFSRMIDNFANDPNQILQFGTKLENDHFSALDPKYNIQYSHAYTVKGYNPETGMVLISNPWHSGLTIEIPKSQLLKDMDAMTIYDLNQIR